MAYEETFYIDIINKKAVKNLLENIEVPEWKQYHGSIIPIRVYAVKPIANANRQPFYAVEPIEPLNLKVTLGIVPDESKTSEIFHREFKITQSSWADDTETNSWTAEFDLDDDDLRDIVSTVSPIQMILQFDFQVGASWVTGCQLQANIYKSININN